MSGVIASQLRQAARRTGYLRPSGEPNALQAGKGYTIAHAGRQVRFGPVAFWIAVGTVVIMAGWSAATATYFAFRDDVLKSLIARHAQQQFAYEDRIAELRARIDRTTSRQLLDQEQFEHKLDDLLRRQAALESRATALSGIADPTVTGSTKGRSAEPGRLAKPSPTTDSASGRRPLDRGTFLEPFRAPPSDKRQRHASLDAKLTQAELSLDRVERHQVSALSQMRDRYESKAKRLRGVLATLGLRLSDTADATGGPFVPVKLPNEANAFARALTRVTIARAEADQLGRKLATVPLHKPLTGEIEYSSTFGVRMDPFLHVAAMHTGIDFRGEIGQAVHATAAGVVTSAGWSGGYGKMVEIDHGNGLATRYGHLSQIEVAVGDKVRLGQIVGRMGSTGRSTGPHLHYETRVGGEAVDPQKFLDAGAKLFGD